MRTAVLFLALSAGTLVTFGCAQHRTVQDEATLIALREKSNADLASRRSEAFTNLAARLKHEHEAFVSGATDQPAILDILVLSGGGDYGAFGAGVLKGWGRVQSPRDARRPEFDVVLGVSTGALIAPFAYLGTDADIEKIEELYSNPRPDWVRERWPLFFLPSNVSFAEVPGLERDLRAAVDRDRIDRIAVETAKGRLLIVNATNIDDGSAFPFDVGHACMQAQTTGDIDRVHRMLLASSGIPGAFPPREIDGSMFVDGGVTANIIYGGAIKQQDAFPAVWSRTVPGVPVPRMRYWVIVNNQLVTPPKTTQPSWMPVVARSVETSIRASTVTSLRHLMALVELMRVRDGTDVEIHLLAIPDAWRAPKPGVFVKETMDDLTALGERLGADPHSWTQECP